MKALTSTTFDKQYEKLPEKVQKQFKKRIRLFLGNPRDRSLNIHKLQGDKKEFTSINVTGNYRALFKWLDKETIRLHTIGTHSQLYG